MQSTGFSTKPAYVLTDKPGEQFTAPPAKSLYRSTCAADTIEHTLCTSFFFVSHGNTCLIQLRHALLMYSSFLPALLHLSLLFRRNRPFGAGPLPSFGHTGSPPLPYSFCHYNRKNLINQDKHSIFPSSNEISRLLRRLCSGLFKHTEPPSSFLIPGSLGRHRLFQHTHRFPTCHC